MSDVDRVALLALIYREHHNAHHSGPEGLLDFESCPGEVNLATMLGSESLTGFDWLLIRAMQTGCDLNPLAAELDSTRAEALLHAWPPEACAPPDGAWTLPYGADRWQAVEAKMQRLRDEGLTASRDDVELVAVAVYEAVTDKNHAAYLDEYADSIFLD